MKKGATPNEVGKEAEKLVKKSLWRRNYRVKDVSYFSPAGCDLIVNATHRIEVKSMRGTTTSVHLDPANFDVFCLVVFEATSTSIFYLKNKDDLEKLKVKYSNDYHINVEKLREFFTKKPQEVLGETFPVKPFYRASK